MAVALRHATIVARLLPSCARHDNSLAAARYTAIVHSARSGGL